MAELAVIENNHVTCILFWSNQTFVSKIDEKFLCVLKTILNWGKKRMSYFCNVKVVFVNGVTVREAHYSPRTLEVSHPTKERI